MTQLDATLDRVGPDDAVSYAVDVAIAGHEAARRASAEGSDRIAVKLRRLVARLWAMIAAAVVAATASTATQLRATAREFAAMFARSMTDQVLDAAGLPA